MVRVFTTKVIHGKQHRCIHLEINTFIHFFIARGHQFVQIHHDDLYLCALHHGGGRGRVIGWLYFNRRGLMFVEHRPHEYTQVPWYYGPGFHIVLHKSYVGNNIDAEINTNAYTKINIHKYMHTCNHTQEINQTYS